MPSAKLPLPASATMPNEFSNIQINVATPASPSFSAFIAPRYWPTWLGIAALCLIAWLPFRLRMLGGSVLGWLTYKLARERRYITSTNIGLCFPELSQQQQRTLVRQVFLENGIGLIETACGWIRPASQFSDLLTLQGEEAFQQALDEGRGVLMLGAHYSMLDFGANLLSISFPFGTTFRPHNNPVIDAFMLRGRLRNCNGVFDRRDIRGAFRHLREGKILWYAPDQDYGPEQSLFAPFFGQTAATITATSRFARIGKSAVFMVNQRRDSKTKSYIMEFTRVSDEFPGDDEVANATLINHMLEQDIRKAPAQYMWMHKRFKTQQRGKPDSPYIYIRTHNRKLTINKHQELTQGASSIAPQKKENQQYEQLLLSSGLQLRTYPGLAKGLTRYTHITSTLDKLTKHLRSHHVATITIDSIFRIPHLKATALTVFVPAGDTVSPQHAPSPAALADFLLRLHNCGCSFIHPDINSFVFDGTTLALNDPAGLQQQPGTTAIDWRARDIIKLLQQLSFTAEQIHSFHQHYLQGTVWHERPLLEEKLAAIAAHPHNANTL